VLSTLNLPPIRFGAENELIPDINVTIADDSMAGNIDGKIIVKNILILLAPKLLAASIVDASRYLSDTETFK